MGWENKYCWSGYNIQSTPQSQQNPNHNTNNALCITRKRYLKLYRTSKEPLWPKMAKDEGLPYLPSNVLHCYNTAQGQTEMTGTWKRTKKRTFTPAAGWFLTKCFRKSMVFLMSFMGINWILICKRPKQCWSLPTYKNKIDESLKIQ